MTNSTMRAPATSPSPVTGEATSLSHRQILTILSGTVLGMFLAALDQNIVSVAIVPDLQQSGRIRRTGVGHNGLPDHRDDHHAAVRQIGRYLRSKAVLSHRDRLFVVGSVACTFATSMYELAGFRAFQGLGAGGLMSLAFTIVGDIAPARERVRYQGYFMDGLSVSRRCSGRCSAASSPTTTISAASRAGAGCSWSMCRSALFALVVVAKVLNVPHQRQNHGSTGSAR